ncbi:sensor histidine kinase [Nocardioides pacificus]
MTGTTERGRRRPLPQFSVRTRLVVVIALLTGTAMGVAGVLVFALESQRIDRAVTEQIDQEIAEFRQLQTSGNDPDTAQPFREVSRLLEVFLMRNVPDDDEMLVGYYRGRERDVTPNRYGQEILDEPAYVAAVERLLEDGGTDEIRSPEFGEVWVTVVPVRSARDNGGLIIVSFLDDEHSEINRTMQTYAIVALLALGTITALAAWQSGRLLAPLRTLRETAAEITATDLSRRIPERGNDDITALTRTLNDMLDRLESGFAHQRQFLDDAGHELKTPLTVLRGHLELVDLDDPADVAETRELLIDEVDRMSRLVGDLILLAKSRRPDFLTPRPFGLGPLTHSVLAKAQGLADRDWRLDGTGEGTVLVDEQRLTQALLQLADNAVKHTGPGDVIAIGSSYEAGPAAGGEGGTVRLWVRDGGPGVPEDERERIFERFGRGAVHPGDEGFGLGLSIVSAIAVAHAGTVHVEDADPTGARFVITLPAGPPADPPTGRRTTSQEDTWPAS